MLIRLKQIKHAVMHGRWKSNGAADDPAAPLLWQNLQIYSGL